MIENYLQILKESLEKKIVVLDQIKELGERESVLYQEETVDLEAFDKVLEEKDALADQLVKLDEGFETLYDRIREELQTDRSKYATQIETLQQLIGQVTDRTTAIQAQDKRLKMLFETGMSRQKQQIGQSRKSVKALKGYAQTRSTLSAAESIYMDTKK